MFTERDLIISAAVILLMVRNYIKYVHKGKKADHLLVCSGVSKEGGSEIQLNDDKRKLS